MHLILSLFRSDTDMSIDPNEPLYCYCQQVSFGEMVACDNADVSLYFFRTVMILI